MLPEPNEFHPPGRNGKVLDVTLAILCTCVKGWHRRSARNRCAGLAIAAMAALRVMFPPAGTGSLMVPDNPEWEYIGLPVAAGSSMLVMSAWLYHRLPARISFCLFGHVVKYHGILFIITDNGVFHGIHISCKL